MPSIAEYSIPARIAGKLVTVITDVVESNIPLLFSLQKMNAQIHYGNDTAVILGNKVDLNFTSSGHHCISTA